MQVVWNATAGHPQEAGSDVGTKGEEGWPSLGLRSRKPSHSPVNRPEGLQPGRPHKSPGEKVAKCLNQALGKGCKEGRLASQPFSENAHSSFSKAGEMRL